jgi:PAS domain S-box-containing protein
MRLRRADGEFRWHHARCAPLHDQQGGVVQWYGLCVDIDERKKAEDRLRRSEAHLAEAERLTHAGTLVLNATTWQYIYLSDESYRIWGLDPLQGLPSHETIRQRFHPDDRDEVWQKVQEALRQKKDYSGEFRIVLPNGTVKYLAVTAHHLFSENGELAEVIATSVDVTERKRAEDRLRRSEIYLAEAQRLSHTGSFGWTPSTGQLHWSDETFRILEYDPSIEPTIERVLQRIHPDDRAMIRRLIDEISSGEKDFDVAHRLLMPDGSVKFVHVLSHALKDATGNLEIVGALMDVTANTLLYRDLAEREAKIRRLVDSNIIGIFIWDFDGHILEANDAFLRMLNYDREDLVSGRICWTELTPPDWRDRNNLRIETYKSSGHFPSFEKEYTRKDGTRVPVLMGGATFEQGGNQGMAYVLDLTERKRAEQRLSVQHTVAQILAEAVTIEEATLRILRAMGECLGWDVGVLWRVDRKAEALRCVELWHKASIEIPEFERVSRKSTFVPGLGLPGRVWSSLEPEYVPDVVPDENFPRGPIAEREELHAALAFPILLEGEALGVIEFFSREIRQPDQELLNVLATIGSQIGQFIERKRGEEALRESEGKLRDYAETASDWFWEIGPDYKFTLLTENAFGSNPADRIGTACWDHALDLETEPEKWRLVRATLESRKPFRDFVYWVLGGNGSPMYVKASGKPVFDADGQFRGYRGTGTDVTALIRAQEEHDRLRQLESDLAHMNRLSMMGELAASLSHEITQPIASARNNARAAQNFLDMQPPDFDEVREALSCIVGDTDRAGDIVDRIRDHIKKAPPREERVDLNQAITDVIALAQGAISKNGVSVQTRLTEGLPHVQADRVQVQQIVLNLILNAVEAMSLVKKGARELAIITERHKAGGVLVAVRDSGLGIDPKQLDRVFDAFYTTKSGGVGMGLSICRSIIDAHGGRLWAEANEPRGAVFQFTLPSAARDLTNHRQFRESRTDTV